MNVESEQLKIPLRSDAIQDHELQIPIKKRIISKNQMADQIYTLPSDIFMTKHRTNPK